MHAPNPIEHRATPDGERSDAARVDLYWIPLGAGADVVRVSGKMYAALTHPYSGVRGTRCTTGVARQVQRARAR